MKFPKHFKLLMLGVSFALTVMAVAACGGGGPEELEIGVKLEGDKLSPETIQVVQGDTVTLKIEPERPGEIHLHGYDIEKGLEAGQVTELVFVAGATGRFRITFHAAAEQHSHNGEQPGPDAGGQNGTPESDGSSHEADHDEGEEVDVGFLEVLPR